MKHRNFIFVKKGNIIFFRKNINLNFEIENISCDWKKLIFD